MSDARPRRTTQGVRLAIAGAIALAVVGFVGWAIAEIWSSNLGRASPERVEDARYLAALVSAEGQAGSLTGDLAVLVRQATELPQLAGRPDWLERVDRDADALEQLWLTTEEVVPPAKRRELHALVLQSLYAQVQLSKKFKEAAHDHSVPGMKQSLAGMADVYRLNKEIARLIAAPVRSRPGL